MRPIPADSLGHAHGLLRAIDKRGRLRTDEFVTEFSLEELFPPDLENALGRMRHFISYARAAGLVKEDRGVVELTEIGRRYIRSGEPDAPFAVGPQQAEWLRRQLREKHMTDSIFHGLAIGMSLLASTPPGTRVSTMDFGRSMAYLGRAGWDNENTLQSQGERHLTLLQQMELIDDEHRLTPTGDLVRGELTLPVHMSLPDIAAQLNPGGADAVREAAEKEWAEPIAPPEPVVETPPPTAPDEPEEAEDNGYHTVADFGSVSPTKDEEESPRPPIVPRAAAQSYPGDDTPALSSGDPLAGPPSSVAPPTAGGDPLAAEPAVVYPPPIEDAPADARTMVSSTPSSVAPPSSTPPAPPVSVAPRAEAPVAAPPLTPQPEVPAAGSPAKAPLAGPPSDAAAGGLVAPPSEASPAPPSNVPAAGFAAPAAPPPSAVAPPADFAPPAHAGAAGPVPAEVPVSDSSAAAAAPASGPGEASAAPPVSAAPPADAAPPLSPPHAGAAGPVPAEASAAPPADAAPSVSPPSHTGAAPVPAEVPASDSSAAAAAPASGPAEASVAPPLDAPAAASPAPPAEASVAPPLDAPAAGSPAPPAQASAAPSAGAAPPPVSAPSEASGAARVVASPAGVPLSVAPPVPSRRAPSAGAREVFVEAWAIRAAAEEAGLRLGDGVYANAAAALDAGKHLVLTGAPGSGKTTLALAIARAAAQAGQAKGATVITGAPAQALVTDAAARGRWVIADELDQADLDAALKPLSTLLAGVPVTVGGEEAEPAPGWRIVATWNGSSPRGAAVLRRFAAVDVARPPADELKALLQQDDPTAQEAVELLLALGLPVGAGVLREAANHIRARQAAVPTDASTLADEAVAAYFSPLLDL